MKGHACGQGRHQAHGSNADGMTHLRQAEDERDEAYSHQAHGEEESASILLSDGQIRHDVVLT